MGITTRAGTAVLETRSRNDAGDTRYVEYGHINPLEHGRVERVRDWPYSSFHRDVGAGAVRKADYAFRLRSSSYGGQVGSNPPES